MKRTTLLTTLLLGLGTCAQATENHNFGINFGLTEPRTQASHKGKAKENYAMEVTFPDSEASPKTAIKTGTPFAITTTVTENVPFYTSGKTPKGYNSYTRDIGRLLAQTRKQPHGAATRGRRTDSFLIPATRRQDRCFVSGIVCLLLGTLCFFAPMVDKTTKGQPETSPTRST